MSQAKPLLRQGIAHHQAGKLDEAWNCYEKVLQTNPKEPDALHLSGVIATQRGNHEEAARRIRQAIQLAPSIPTYHINLGNALQESGREDAAAEACFRQAIKLNPLLPSAHHNLANLLLRQHREDEAIAEYDQTIVCDPTHINARFSLAKLLAARRNFGLALQVVNGIISIRPNHRDALMLASDAHCQLGQHIDALSYIERTLSHYPEDALAHNWHGVILERLHHFGTALAAHKKALALEPGHPESTASLANILNLMRRPEEGIAALSEGLRHHPDNQRLYSQYLFLLNYSEHLSPSQSLAAHINWNQRFVKDLHRMSRHQDWLVVDQRRRLRIGYVSGDFKSHSVAFFLEPLLEKHRRNEVEVFCYSTSDLNDHVTHRLQQLADQWRPVAKLEDGALAELIVADQIDILVDLAGHTDGNRLLTFARKPSPVQITYLGYPNTTGVNAIDYRITDARADPLGTADGWSSEKLIRLPNCFHCYRPGQHAEFDPTPPVFRQGKITFASFNVLSKISESTCETWSKILHAVPDSQLLVKTLGLKEDEVRNNLRTAFAKYGIAQDRLLLDGAHLPHDQHMQRYRGVDICLDTFPYNGTTTTCDALWMGVPVISLRGDRHVARVGFSLLHAIGASELVADSVDQYVAIAAGLAHDQQRIASYHASLRQHMLASPLMDETRFVADLEEAYRQVWRDWCLSAQH